MIHQYNGCEEKCPVPLIKTRLLLKKMQANDSCIIYLCDEGSITDIPKLLTKLGYNYCQSINDHIVKIIINKVR